MILQDLGNIATKREGNRHRDLARHLRKRGFMLPVQVAWLKNVLWHRWQDFNLQYFNNLSSSQEGVPKYVVV